MTESNARWKITLVYRSEVGPVDVEHDIEELSEIDALIEAGPHWDTIIKGTFVLNRPSVAAGLTVEKAEQL